MRCTLNVYSPLECPVNLLAVVKSAFPCDVNEFIYHVLRIRRSIRMRHRKIDLTELLNVKIRHDACREINNFRDGRDVGSSR